MRMEVNKMARMNMKNGKKVENPVDMQAALNFEKAM